MAVDNVGRLTLTSTPHPSEDRHTSLAIALPVGMVFALSVLWPAFGEFVTVLLKIAVLYIFSTH